MADGPPSETCPTPCDPDCDADCHELHQPRWKWQHDPRSHGVEPPSETCVECGVAINDPEWSRNSGGLCADCLADNALPLTRIEPPFESVDIVLWCAEGNIDGDPPHLDPQAFLRDLDDAGWVLVKVRDE